MVKAEDVLRDDQNFAEIPQGGTVRKGTIAATILSAADLETLLKKTPSEERNSKIEAVVRDIRELVPGLHAVALFDFFTPLEWLHTLPSIREGKAFVAVLYLQQYPQILNHELRARLDQVKRLVSPELKKEIEKLLS